MAVALRSRPAMPIAGGAQSVSRQRESVGVTLVCPQMRHLRPVCTVALLSFLAFGCAAEGEPLSEGRKAELRALAHDYQFKAVDEAQSLSIKERIRALDQPSAEQFRDYLNANAGYTGRELLYSKLFQKICDERGISFLDVHDGSIEREATERLKAVWHKLGREPTIDDLGAI
jgi:hypothetical protein